MMSVKSFLRLYCFLFASFGFSPEAKRELGQENQARLDAEAHGVEAEKKKKKTKEETKGTSSVEQKGSLTQKVLDLFWKTDEGDSNTVGVGRTEIAKVKTENKTPVDSSLMQLGGFEDFFTTPAQFPATASSYKQPDGSPWAYEDMNGNLHTGREDFTRKVGIRGPMAGEGLEVRYDSSRKGREWTYSFFVKNIAMKDRQVKLQWHAKHIEDLDEKAPVELHLDEKFKNPPTAKAFTYWLSSRSEPTKGGVKFTPTLHIFTEGADLMLVEFEETEISKPEVKELEEAKKKLQEAKAAKIDVLSYEETDHDEAYSAAVKKWRAATGMGGWYGMKSYKKVIARMEKKVKELEAEISKPEKEKKDLAQKVKELEETKKKLQEARLAYHGLSYPEVIAAMDTKIAALETEIADLSA